MLKKMAWFCVFTLLCLLGGASQESVEVLPLHDPNALQAFSHKGFPVAVSVDNQYLTEISSSVLKAESWLKTHVLGFYPSTQITTIVVAHNVLCNMDQNLNLLMGLILPSVKNIHHSLTRWGLERDIKVSVSISSSCLNPSSATYRDDLSETYLKPLLMFLKETDSSYLVNPPPNFGSLPEETLSLVSSHSESMKNLGVYGLNKINVVVGTLNGARPISRKLSFVDTNSVPPFPARPTPLLSPNQAPIGYSSPAFAANSPLPPLVGISPPAPFAHPIAPAYPPYHHNWPPCKPSRGEEAAPPAPPVLGAAPKPPVLGAAPEPPVLGAKSEIWCVAKPSVPADTLQEAMDYACGEGGGDCEAIKPYGSCYSPDTILAHASYAFNSYWQKNKRNGGTCSFGGTAMLINADPSFQQCQFILT